MIIDLRTRIATTADPGSDPTEPSSEAHLEAMACVDVAVVVGYRCDRIGRAIPTTALAEQVRQFPERRLAFAGVDPSAPDAAEQIDEAAAHDFAGVTIAPADQACRPTDDRCLALLESAAERRLPVLVANPMLASASSMLEYASPALLDEAARSIPNLTLILGDLAAGWLDETLLMVGKHDRVYAEISGVVARPGALYTLLLSAHERGLMHKLLFGSGFPAETPERAIERLYTLNAGRNGALPAIPREAIRQIVERDALAALGVSHLLRRPPAEPVLAVAGPAAAPAFAGNGVHTNGAPNGRIPH